MSGTLEQGGRYTVPNCAKASLGVPESSFLWELVFSVGDKPSESQKGCSGVDGRGWDWGLQTGQEHSPHSGVRPASGESLPLEPRAVIGLSAWTRLCLVAFVEPLKHTDDAVS